MDEKTSQRIREIFEGIENAVMMCADDNERLMMAGCMLQTTGKIYDRVIGKEGRRTMFLEAAVL